MDWDVLLLQETRNASQELLHNTMAPGGHKLIVNKHKGHGASIVVHRDGRDTVSSSEQHERPLVGLRTDSRDLAYGPDGERHTNRDGPTHNSLGNECLRAPNSSSYRLTSRTNGRGGSSIARSMTWTVLCHHAPDSEVDLGMNANVAGLHGQQGAPCEFEDGPESLGDLAARTGTSWGNVGLIGSETSWSRTDAIRRGRCGPTPGITPADN